MNPLTLLSLLSTGVSLVTGKSLTGAVIQGVQDLLGGSGTGENAQNFAGLLESTKSSLNVTPQGGISSLQALGAASLTAANSGEAITDETLQTLNELLGTSGHDDSEVTNALSETDTDDTNTDGATATNAGGILGQTKLDDPFGIKAAEANGSPVAAVTPVTPLVGAESGNAVNEDGEVVSGSTTAKDNIVDAKAILQNGVPEKSNVAEKDKLFQLGEKIENKRATNKLGEKNNSAVISEKLLEAKAGSSSALAPQTDKLANKINSNADVNPATAAFLGRDVDTRSIGDAARTVRGKDDLKEKLSEIDTYKVAHVTKKDNVLDLRLEPAQLGRVQIKFDFTDGKTNIMVTADRQETLDLLQKDTKSIQKILTDNGIASNSNSMSFNLSQQQKQQDNNFGFFTGKPLSFRVEQEVSQVAANINNNEYGYSQYGEAAGNGMLNIIV